MKRKQQQNHQKSGGLHQWLLEWFCSLLCQLMGYSESHIASSVLWVPFYVQNKWCALIVFKRQRLYVMWRVAWDCHRNSFWTLNKNGWGLVTVTCGTSWNSRQTLCFLVSERREANWIGACEVCRSVIAGKVCKIKHLQTNNHNLAADLSYI